MVEGAGGHVLFSGCAYARNGTAPRHATIALVKALHVDPVYEAPDTGCCGARADRRVGDDARLKTLAPVYDLAQQGLDVICLSPACRRVVAAYLPATHGPARRPIQVRDVIQLLDGAYGLPRLANSVRRSLFGLRVALHSTCHANHNAVVREQFLTGGTLAKGLANVTAVLSGSTPLPRLLREHGAVVRTNKPAEATYVAALANVVATVGAQRAPDVSLSGHCAEVALPMGLSRFVSGRRQPAPCLALAVQAGADVLVTPCFLCYMGLNGQQRALPGTHPGRGIPVLHISQLVGLACEASPRRLELARTTVSARRALSPFLA